ncbi:uncharacterized protein BDZ99DRAFT_457911 [Mytilinidion resinicola]|uniref:Uncharacterized protein n=1 Tax=Mytilinidion resinicola TaxID=574789 RepID=A0A6A6Z5Q4_9PEZI|nr:uncharacterized protein BDZ99DRAFT_457911 [Mytilinidion resinicola]KAF2815993.1 hypothetical protein BDZ99DRAFT_457911 [Mytilinidion resinicola]
MLLSVYFAFLCTSGSSAEPHKIRSAIGSHALIALLIQSSRDIDEIAGSVNSMRSRCATASLSLEKKNSLKLPIIGFDFCR